MDLAQINLDAAIFSQRDAVAVCTVENATIDNWLRHGHVALERDADGRRLFTGWDLVTIDLIAFLVERFGVKPSDASRLAGRIVEQYRPLSASDVDDMGSGQRSPRAWLGIRQPEPYYFTRGEDGFLRDVRDGDSEIDQVGIVVPTQLVARRTFGAIQRLEKAA